MERMHRSLSVEDYTQSDLDEIQEEASRRRRREDEERWEREEERYGRWQRKLPERMESPREPFAAENGQGCSDSRPEGDEPRFVPRSGSTYLW